MLTMFKIDNNMNFEQIIDMFINKLVNLLRDLVSISPLSFMGPRPKGRLRKYNQNNIHLNS